MWGYNGSRQIKHKFFNVLQLLVEQTPSPPVLLARSLPRQAGERTFHAESEPFDFGVQVAQFRQGIRRHGLARLRLGLELRSYADYAHALA